MRLPGRGIDCKHFEVMDLEEYVKMIFEKNEEIPCFVCERKCRSLIMDRAVLQEVHKIREQESKDQVKRPNQWLYYTSDGQFIWK